MLGCEIPISPCVWLVVKSLIHTRRTLSGPSSPAWADWSLVAILVWRSLPSGPLRHSSLTVQSHRHGLTAPATTYHSKQDTLMGRGWSGAVWEDVQSID